MQLCFFEDSGFKTFHPLTLTRPVDDLRIGILTIAEKWNYALNASSISRILRPELSGVFESGEINSSQNCLWINSRYLPAAGLLEKINDLSAGQCLKSGDKVIVALVDGSDSRQWFLDGSPNFKNLFVLETVDILSIAHLWDLFQLNGREIAHDLKLLNVKSDGNARISEHAVFENPKEIYVQDGATVEASCVLNADKGPIYIGKNATIMAGAQIRGPVAVCDGATVNMGAKIYPDTTIGPVCKVGGEIHNSVFHSYSNKGHDGYFGNSLVGQWCNFGADTNTSNLKNNYSTIRITNWEDRQEIETGQQFFGAVMGDHSKTAINTQLNTGTICGVCCNIFSNDFPPKLIPSFSWVGSNVIQTYKIEKAFEAMEAMMARRDVAFTESYKRMMQQIFENDS